MHTPIQLFDPASSTYTYLIWDEATREAIIIDPVEEQLQRDLAAIQEHGLKLQYIVETHAHADHITSAAQLIEHTGAQAATPAGCGIKPSAIQLEDGQVLRFGSESLKALHTPGHTAGSMSFTWQTGETSHVFTGDTLLIGGCGRTDFQSGSAAAMYHSLTQVLLKLPDHTIVWPGHDYKGQTHSSIGRERSSNARLNIDGRLRTEAEFIALMEGLNLPRPKRIDEAVPANLSLGARHDANEQHAALTAPQAPKQGGYAGDVSPQLAYQWWKSGQAQLVDIRSHAERAWVGFIPQVPGVEFKIWPGMAVNPDFDAQLKAALGAVPAGSKVILMCRSGVRSIPAAQRAQALGFEAYNMLEGFEGDPDQSAHRNTLGGWRARGLPWAQN
jgi:sulfur dioxygenase